MEQTENEKKPSEIYEEDTYAAEEGDILSERGRSLLRSLEKPKNETSNDNAVDTITDAVDYERVRIRADIVRNLIVDTGIELAEVPSQAKILEDYIFSGSTPGALPAGR